MRGARFDFEEIVCLRPLNALFLKEKAERMLESCGDDPTPRLKTFDEVSGKELMLFIRKVHEIGSTRFWALEGICETKDYEEEMEQNGQIKKWLEIEIFD